MRQTTLHKSLRHSWRILFLLAMLNVQCISELWAQEAFYIYRNDGEFNGFFYDDVHKVQVNLGWEQEYFLVDKSVYDKREDSTMLSTTPM